MPEKKESISGGQARKPSICFSCTLGPVTFANCRTLLSARSSFPKAKVSRSMRVGYRGNRWAHRQRASVSFGIGLPLRRNKRLRRLSRSLADEFSVRQAQLPSLVLHDLLWTQKLKLSRSTRTASRSQIHRKRIVNLSWYSVVLR